MQSSIQSRVGERLSARQETLSTAESCTGGLIASRITDVPGASSFFRGSVVAYSNEAKSRLLGVSAQDIDRFGAVSEPIARQMAKGALRTFGSDWAVAVTGIAGPAGGTPEKPVGLVFIALAGGEDEDPLVTRNHFSGTRTEIREQSAQKALEMLWERLA